VWFAEPCKFFHLDDPGWHSADFPAERYFVAKSPCRNLGRAEVTCAILAFCMTIAVALPAQTFEAITSFNRIGGRDRAHGLLFASGFAQPGVPIAVSPDPISFGNVGLNTTATLKVNVTNITSAPITIPAISITGANTTSFSIWADYCLKTIPEYSGCNVYVNFTPTALTYDNASLAISIQGYSQPINIQISGTGVALSITSLSSTYVYTNSAPFTLTINGTGFDPHDTVYLEGHYPVSSTYVSPTQLTVAISEDEVNAPTTYGVFVVSRSRSSNSVNLNVVPAVPTIGSVSPVSITAGSSDTFVLVIGNGNQFMPGATVMWNGEAVPTTFRAPNALSFYASKSQLASASIAQITVQNPAPGGGLSAPVDLDVTYPVTILTLDLVVNQIIFDPNAQLFYASLPSGEGAHSNSIAVIDPVTGNVIAYHFAGNGPNHLALSPDSRYLYIGMDGSGSVQRFILPGFTPDIEVSLGHNPLGLFTAYGLQVDPSDDHTWAVSVWGPQSNDFVGVYFYTDTTQLPDAVTSVAATQLIWVNSSTMYGYATDTLSQITTNSTGGTFVTQWDDLVEGPSIAYADGLIYGAAGEVLNPTTGLLVGSYDVDYEYCYCDTVLPDPAINRVFVLGETPVAPFFSVTTFNLSQFTAEASANLISQVVGGVAGPPMFWGSSGLAFTLNSDQVIFVNSPAMFSTGSGSKSDPSLRVPR
jgi:hypothetical protein